MIVFKSYTNVLKSTFACMYHKPIFLFAGVPIVPVVVSVGAITDQYGTDQ